LSELGSELPELSISGDLQEALRACKPDVLIDFTAPSVVRGKGTTGLTEDDLKALRGLCESTETPAIIAPNFSIGAVLMMQYAANAARVFDYAEIIEYHHENKKDSPSGTAVKTAEMMLAARRAAFIAPETELERIPGCRGGEKGFVANQEVILGGPGETLSIHHLTTSRESFMPGVLLAVRKVRDQRGLVYGLEHLLNL